MSEKEKPLTPAMVRDYVDCEGTHCPFCRSSEIEAGTVDADGAFAWSRVTCKQCGEDWQDVFFLGAVDTIDENGRHGDTVMPAGAESDGSASRDAAILPSAWDFPAA